MDKSSSLGMPMAPLEYIQEVKIIKAWGCPRHPLVLHQSGSGHLSNTMFLFVHAISAISWSIRCFSFQYCVVCFVLLNKIVGPNKVCFGERHAPLSLSRTLYFRFDYPASVLFF